MSGANKGTSGLPVPKRKNTGEPPVPKAARHIPRFAATGLIAISMILRGDSR